MSSYKDNFGIMIPTDIVRHSDGTACSFIENKQDFVEWIKNKSIGVDDYEKLSGKDKELLVTEFKNKQ